MFKFDGETNWDAVVNRNSLDIEEEDSFSDFVGDKKDTASLEELEAMHQQWSQNYAD